MDEFTEKQIYCKSNMVHMEILLHTLYVHYHSHSYTHHVYSTRPTDVLIVVTMTARVKMCRKCLLKLIWYDSIPWVLANVIKFSIQVFTINCL